MCYQKIRCQENCPYNKECCFGEIECDRTVSGKIVQRHKCKISGAYITIVIHNKTV